MQSYSEKRGLPAPRKGYLQENKKADPVSLAFSQLGEECLMIVSMMLAMTVIMINMIIAFASNTNITDKGLKGAGIFH